MERRHAYSDMNNTKGQATTKVKVTARTVTPAQQQAWRQLWRLLTKDKAKGNGKGEISTARL
jgi:hypothetical protein